MQIRNILSGFSDPTIFGRRSETQEAGDVAKREAANSEISAPINPAGSLAEILARYDVTDITPDGFSDMLQTLYDTESISDQELRQLAGIRQDLDEAGIDPDESVDLLQFYIDQIDEARRDAEDSENPTADLQKFRFLIENLDWMQKFALIQSAPDVAGLNELV